MKFGSVSIALMLATTSMTQVHFELPASGYKFDAALGGASSDAVSKQTRFLFEGHARMTSKELEFRSEHMKGLLSTPSGAKQPVLRHAETAGEGVVVRTVRTDHGVDVTTVTGSRFVFDGDDRLGALKIAGSVKITDMGSGKSNLLMTGTSGAVEFDMKQGKVQSAFRKANLDGAVAVDIAQVGKGAGILHATGDHLVYDHVSTPPTIVMTGHIFMHGQRGGEIGSASGVKKLKLQLNSRGDFTHLDVGEGTG